jgi:hypothetical protein
MIWILFQNSNTPNNILTPKINYKFQQSNIYLKFHNETSNTKVLISYISKLICILKEYFMQIYWKICNKLIRRINKNWSNYLLYVIMLIFFKLKTKFEIQTLN